MPAVFAVDVLDDFFAPLVLEVDVDVGWFVAFGADEALEQHAHSRRVDLGDTQAITHRRIGRAAAPLAQDALGARPLHDVGHGQEVGLVFQLRDQRELVLHQAQHLGRWACRKALRRVATLQAGLRELAQMRGRRFTLGNDLLRVFVAQLVERKAATPGEHQRLLEPRGFVQAAEPRERTQVRLGVGFELPAALRHRQAQARGAERVLQGLARAHVHQHVAGGDECQARQFGDTQHGVEQGVLKAAVQQLNRNECALLEPGLEPQRLREQRFEVLAQLRHEQRQAIGQAGEERGVRHPAFDIGRIGKVAALFGAAPRHRDPLRQVAVAAPRLREQHQARQRCRCSASLLPLPLGEGGGEGCCTPLLRRRRQPHLAADDQMQSRMALRLDMRAHHAGERALVGDRNRGVAQLRGAHDQLFRVRGTGQEAEIAAAVKFSVTGEHAVADGMKLSIYTVSCTQPVARLQGVFDAPRIFASKPSTRSRTAAGIVMTRPHCRSVSPGHLFVASSPSLPPRPLTGDAKSR